MSNRKLLGDLLIDTGLITKDQLDKALTVQKKTGERLGKVLINLGYLTEENMVEVLEFQLGVPHVRLADIQFDPVALAALPASLATRYHMIPVSKHGARLRIAMSDPTNFYAVDDARKISGFEIDTVIASEQEIALAIDEHYGVRGLVEKAVSKIRPDEAAAPVAEVTMSEDAPVVSVVNSLISQAVKDRASDIHLEPQSNLVRVRYRVDGILREVVTFPRHMHPALISRIKIMSDMDIAEKRLPQDGRIKVKEEGRDIDLRVSTLPTILGEKVVIRILDRKAVILDIKGLGFSKENLSAFQYLYARSYGMILVTGPTGSGKTTTLYSTLTEINSPTKNIITVEDPVEYRLEGVNQVQVNSKAGLTFANGLRSILRQDPNVIMVGEVRDAETADIAIRAALTGHLVFSTLHTNDAAGAVTRLVDMGIEPFLVSSSILGVMAQRLVRQICRHCRQRYVPAPDSPERIFLGLREDEEIRLYRGAGCPYCGNTGYQGRMAIHEVMPVTAKIRDAIGARAAADDIVNIAVKEGMRTMRQDGIDKALAGLTTIDEVMRVAFSGTV